LLAAFLLHGISISVLELPNFFSFFTNEITKKAMESARNSVEAYLPPEVCPSFCGLLVAR
jgi:hypothetical protein